jgi:hypothetical protein
MKPCPAKLPEEYCKICRRLNSDVAHFCKTRKLPEKPEREILEQDIPLKRFEPKEEEEEEVDQPAEIQRRSPILERPTYRDGDTSLEFVSSQRSLDEAKKSLPRFIPVRKGPRTFRPIEDEFDMEFEAFSPSRSSIFKEPSLLGQDEDDMMFTMVDDDAIEVLPVEVLSEDTYSSETVFSSAEGVVEVIDDHEDMPLMTFEEEVPAFEFMPSDAGEIIEAEIVEAEIVEDEPSFETYTTQEQIDETKQGIQDLTEEITNMTESLEKEFQDNEFAFTPTATEVQKEEPVEPEPIEPENAELAPEIPAESAEMRFEIKEEIQAQEPQVPKGKLKKKMKLKKTKKKKVKKTKKKKSKELEPIEDHAFIPQIEEPVSEPIVEEPEPIVEEPVPEPVVEEPVSEPIVEEPYPETYQAEPEPITEEPYPEAPQEEPQVPKKRLKMKLRKSKKKKVKKSKKKDLEPVEDHAFIPQVEEPQPEPVYEEPFSETPQEEPKPVVEEPYPETYQEEPEPIIEEPEPNVEEPFPDTEIEEPEPIIEEPEPVVEEPFPDTEIEEPEPIIEEPEQIAEEPFPDTEIEESEPIIEEPEPIVEEPIPVAEVEEPSIEPQDEEPEDEMPKDQPFPQFEIKERPEEIGFPINEPVEPQETPIEATEEDTSDGGAADLYMCPSCGAFVSGSASVCIKCGYDFEAEEQGDQGEEPPYEPFEEPPTSDDVTFQTQSEGELPIEEGAEPSEEFSAEEEQPEEEEPPETKPKKKKKKKVKLKKKMKLKKVKKK